MIRRDTWRDAAGVEHELDLGEYYDLPDAAAKALIAAHAAVLIKPHGRES